MRKNAVNKQLNTLDGGVCAVAGFTASSVRCGFDTEYTGDDVGLIFADKKCAVAFLGDSSKMCGAPVKVSRHNASFGYVRGVLFNNAVANVYGEGSERLCRQMAWEVARRLRVDATSIIVGSTGTIGKPLSLEQFARGVPELLQGLDFKQTNDFALAKALDNNHPKQLAVSFELGDFICKIGAVFKGNTRVAPNLATTLCFITTDVNISPEMLQKALGTVVNDTFNQLCIDCVSSPNDCVCILANGKAGNYKISSDDSEYKKFVYALSETMDRICKQLTCNLEEDERSLLCKVKGAKSKKLARDVAKSVVSSSGIKDRFSNGEVCVNDFYGAIASAGERVEETALTVAIATQDTRIILLEEGKTLFVSAEAVKQTLFADEVTIEIILGTGNYSATGYGRRKRLREN